MIRKQGIPGKIKQKHKELEYTTEVNLSDNLDENKAALQQAFSNCDDLVVRDLHIFGVLPCVTAYLDVLVDDTLWDNGLLAPLMLPEKIESDNPAQLIEQIKNKLGSVAKPEIASNLKEIVQRIVKGDVILFIKSSSQALRFSIKDQLHRQLEEPSTEAVIRGPQIGFIEKLHINMALIRQRIRTPYLKMEKLSVGSISRADVSIIYIENKAPQTVIDDVKQRLAGIDMESILESGYIEELISDHPYSPFPVIQATQRPDLVSASLIEGKVALLVDGSPFALIMPITLWFGFQTVEDYYMNFIFATMLRWLRYLFAFLAFALPSIFVAITTFHQEMIPTSLTLSLAAAREVVPFPAMVETLIMEITFEALREAGVRLPRPVGQTISIVGALVIGQAAVQAGIISAPIIIIVSLTGIASFLIPHPGMSQAFSLLRFPMVICAGTFGLFGVSAGMIAILIHLTNLHSFGVPYLTPLAPFNRSGLMDVLIRAPWQIMHKRQNKR
ncbi:spore germination protein KA [Paenibacillus algorifonticola]|uniref:Spore germination protein KA n=1 Tax=Paenibacillus algorifonticola TaxID=684063 RepID=A0A1I2IPA8_9BACL|nr:spore germination protein [Paenibacillus algorifonticola]SFF42666.1 spore germination protein KA [Paenibacillus algorifonticola]